MRSRLDRVANWPERARIAHYEGGNLAHLCSVSPSQLLRYFQAKYDATPQEWLIRLRCEDSLRLLGQSELSIKEIAFRLHFHHPGNYCRQFKSIYGCSPSAYISELIGYK